VRARRGRAKRKEHVYDSTLKIKKKKKKPPFPFHPSHSYPPNETLTNTDNHQSPTTNHVPPTVLACLFVARDNTAGRALYDKAGFFPVSDGVDLRRKRFGPLLEAGALGVEEVDSVVFMVKYIPPEG
jgi:hypothetical protein